MIMTACVAGVLGLCWVDFLWSTQAKSAFYAGCRGGVVGVLGLSSRTRMRVLFERNKQVKKNPHAIQEKPNKPNTVNTLALKILNLLGFMCVGFVLGIAVLCWVRDFRGIQG
ncbi:hypothetical protein [Pseudomonas sp. HLS-6]|uniref:hypothetical protein n=1 Tax=Pseudomonas sp. HLS-6 TaxID=2049589 RepID=UPI002113EE8D|nr:hypothetical protein [Pseudomonas sp. HLS-6]